MPHMGHGPWPSSQIAMAYQLCSITQDGGAFNIGWSYNDLLYEHHPEHQPLFFGQVGPLMIYPRRSPTTCPTADGWVRSDPHGHHHVSTSGWSSFVNGLSISRPTRTRKWMMGELPVKLGGWNWACDWFIPIVCGVGPSKYVCGLGTGHLTVWPDGWRSPA